MREILFRGYNYQYEKWFYGSLITQNYEGDFVLSNTKNIIIDDRLNQVVVDSGTIGQYTGLTDKNGVKIFEGDILLVGERRRKVNVVFKDGSFGYLNQSEFCIPFQYQNPEVIGNIYDEVE